MTRARSSHRCSACGRAAPTGGDWSYAISGTSLTTTVAPVHVVTGGDVSADGSSGWSLETLHTGNGAFVPGTGTPPLGTGSYHLKSNVTGDKDFLHLTKVDGVPLLGQHLTDILASVLQELRVRRDLLAVRQHPRAQRAHRHQQRRHRRRHPERRARRYRQRRTRLRADRPRRIVGHQQHDQPDREVASHPHRRLRRRHPAVDVQAVDRLGSAPAGRRRQPGLRRHPVGHR